jgi:hypothetical protein
MSLFSMAFASLALIGFSLGKAGAHAAEMQIDKIGVCLFAPSPWQEKSVEKDVSLVPPDERQNAQKRRRLHLVLPTNPADSLEEEMYREMDRCDARARQWGSSSGRKGFLAAAPVKTKSGIEGIRASFGDISPGKTFYAINKYYLWHRDGSIFKVCAHVYGDQSLADEYDAIIMNGLRYEKSE